MCRGGFSVQSFEWMVYVSENCSTTNGRAAHPQVHSRDGPRQHRSNEPGDLLPGLIVEEHQPDDERGAGATERKIRKREYIFRGMCRAHNVTDNGCGNEVDGFANEKWEGCKEVFYWFFFYQRSVKWCGQGLSWREKKGDKNKKIPQHKTNAIHKWKHTYKVVGFSEILPKKENMVVNVSSTSKKGDFCSRWP